MAFPPSVRLVAFLVGKDEPYTPVSGYVKWKELLEKIFKVQVCQSSIDSLKPDDLDQIILIIIAGPRRKFSSVEFAALQSFRDQGISLFFLLGEGGQDDLPTNINAFLAQSSTGLSFTPDRVLRRAWFKYFHPKQAVINDGLLEDSPLFFPENRLEFVYPFGCTVEVGVAESAIPLLTTGQCCYPSGQPICAISVPLSGQTGKTLCFGSLFAFHDQFLEKEENTKLLSALMEICLTSSKILWKKTSKSEKILDQPSKRIKKYSGMYPTPAVENVFRNFNLEKCFERMKGVAIGDLTSQIRLEMEIERVAKELNVSWDLSEMIILTPLEGFLPDLEFPVFDPEPRIPGEPTLPLLDLDEDLMTWEERLEKLASEADTEIKAENVSLKNTEAMGLSHNSPIGVLQLLVQQIFDYEQKNRKRNISENESINDGSCHNNQSTVQLQFPDSFQPTFDLLSAANYLNSSNHLPITDAEVLQDCLERRSRVTQARAALYDPVETEREFVLPEKDEKPFSVLRSANVSNETSQTNWRPQTVTSSVSASVLRPAEVSNKTSLTSWRSQTATSSLRSTSTNCLSNVDVWRPSDSFISCHSVNSSRNFSNCSTKVRVTPLSGHLNNPKTERTINFDLYDKC